MLNLTNTPALPAADLAPGEIVTIVRRQPRSNAAHVLTRTIGRVSELVRVSGTGETFVLMTPLRVFCWVDGYPELGRFLPSQVGVCCATTSELSRAI